MTEDTSRAEHVAGHVSMRINKAVRKEEKRSLSLASVAVVGTIMMPLSFVVDGWGGFAMDMVGRAMVLGALFVLAFRSVYHYRQYMNATERFGLILAQIAVLHSDGTDESDKSNPDTPTP